MSVALWVNVHEIDDNVEVRESDKEGEGELVGLKLKVSEWDKDNERDAVTDPDSVDEEENEDCEKLGVVVRESECEPHGEPVIVFVSEIEREYESE